MNRVGERARWARIESDIARAINAGHVVSYDWNVWRWRDRPWFLLLPNGEERAFSTREVERWLDEREAGNTQVSTQPGEGGPLDERGAGE